MLCWTARSTVCWWELDTPIQTWAKQNCLLRSGSLSSEIALHWVPPLLIPLSLLRRKIFGNIWWRFFGWCLCLSDCYCSSHLLTIAFMDNQRSDNVYSSSHVSSSVATFWCFLQCQIICCGFCLTSCVEPLPFLFHLSIDLNSPLQGLFSGNFIFLSRWTKQSL